MDEITETRRRIYESYLKALKPLEEEGLVRLPVIPEECESNSHLFYVILPTEEQRDYVLAEMKKAGVMAVFHYVPLHSSPKGLELCGPQSLPVTEQLSARLLRLPLYHGLEQSELDKCTEVFVNAIHRYHGTSTKSPPTVV